MPVNNSINNQADSFTVNNGATTLTPLTTATGSMIIADDLGVLGTIAHSTTNGQLLISDVTGLAPIWANLIPGVGITITNAANSIQIDSTGGVDWAEYIANAALVAEYGFITNKAGTVCTLSLPLTAAIGDVFEVVGKGATGWIVVQNASQQIIFGDQATTVGIAGSIASSEESDCIELICIETDLYFVVKSAVGNLTLA